MIEGSIRAKPRLATRGKQVLRGATTSGRARKLTKLLCGNWQTLRAVCTCTTATIFVPLLTGWQRLPNSRTSSDFRPPAQNLMENFTRSKYDYSMARDLL